MSMRRIHYLTLAALCFTAIVIFIFFDKSEPKVLGAASAVPVSTSSTATILNTGDKIYFDTITHGTNVVIDNYSRQMSGYGWSDDLGWINFGGGGDNPAGPVVADPVGNLSGKALVLNTGNYVDFNSSPAGSNVAITSGNFSGYAWSEDEGWIDFTGVTVPEYNPDLLPPDSATLSTARDSEGGSTSLTSGNWYGYAAPSFSWNVPTDYANGETTPAGIEGYLVYFGSDNTANITRNGYDEVTLGADNGVFTWQTGTTFTNAATLTSNTTYYLKVIAVDGAGNPYYSANSADYNLFTYKYDGTAPTAPAYVSVTPSGYTRTNVFTFIWPVGGSDGSVDTGGSGLQKYQYKVNGGTWQDVSGDWNTSSITLTNAADLGLNVFYLQALDVADNVSTPPVRTNFYYNNTAPSAPRNLTVTPTTSSTNSFAFSWDEPVNYQDSIAGYYYSVNALPTVSNANYTTETSLDSGPFATQQGENTFYVLAKDGAGNVDFSSCNNISGNPTVDGCAKVTFSADTAAPGMPGGLAAFDNSIRSTQKYFVTLNWNEPVGITADFAGYDVYRSTDGVSYAKIGSTSDTVYANGGLSSRLYYYYVVSKDNAGNFSAATAPVSITPTGKFTTPPVLVSGPSYTVNPTSIIVRWATDREASSFVSIKNGNTFVSEQGESAQTTSHEVKVVGLKAQNDYSFSIRSSDVDGNSLTSPEQKFTTANTPSVYDLNISNITQSTAIINFKSTAIANFTLYYGTSPNYGQTITETSGSGTTNHSIALSDLAPGEMYYFRVVGYDSDDNEIRSENSFSTLPMPDISKFAIQSDKDAPSTTLNITWQTNVPTSSTVKYSTNGVVFYEKSTSDLTTDHAITISDLLDKSEYTIYAAGRDQFGNMAESDRVVFDTPTDTRSPKISSIIIESSNVGNSTDKAQIAVSWKTDELANSQVEYDTGINGSEYTRKTVLDSTYTKNHLVIISDLDPGKPYHLRILTADTSGNLQKSGDNTVITGDVSRSALQIILQTMQNIFGWMSSWIK